MEKNDSDDDFLKIPMIPERAIKTESNQTNCVETQRSVNDHIINTGTIVKCEDNGNKRRRMIHLSTCDCFSLAQSNDGSKTLSNPLAIKRNQLDTNKGLYPRHNTRRSVVSQTCASTSCTMSTSATKTNHPQNDIRKNDFVSAKVLHVGALQNVHYDQQSPKKKTFKRKDSSDTINNSILNYFEKSPVKAFDEEMPSQTSSSSLMYSPIKQMSGSIYISDSPQSESDSFNARSQSTPRTNIVSKRLFKGPQAASSEQAKIKTRKPKRSKKPEFDKKQHTLKQESDVLRLGSPPRDPVLEISDTETDLYENLDLSSLCKSHQDRSISSDKYGLLGTGTVPLQTNKKCDSDYFSQLPIEVIENIFCQLPMLDLCLNSNRVCTRWSCIISDVKFSPWKKTYHRCKKDVADSCRNMYELMKSNGMELKKDYLVGLIRYMKDFKPITAGNINECLQQHPKYSWAMSLIEERVSDCCQNEVPNPWSMIATLVVIADKVGDIQGLLRCLLSPTSQCTSMEVLECLYCIATFLYCFKLIHFKDVWNGMHYRLYYALYLHENSSVIVVDQLKSATSGHSGQQTIVKYSDSNCSLRLTHEQMRICNHDIQPREIIKIVAFAGTGKTSTLVRYTQLRPSMRFLLVVYNKSVCEHAKTQFPRNVVCKTGHGLAFGVIGRRYSAANNLHAYGLKVYDIAMNLKKRKGENLYVRAKFVMGTIQNFLASDNEFITTLHVPRFRVDKEFNEVAIEHSDKMNYAEDSEYIWEKMCDMKNQKLRMTHDGYLKLYQLSRPKITNYDCILIDEAQDLTPALADILLSQSQAKILVGDPHQQIYSFRGAVNAMQQVAASRTFYLTQSFRFGPEIASIAACCLEVLKHERKKTLVGNGILGQITGQTVGQVAVITRCNFTLFAEAVKMCCYSNLEVKVAFVGGMKSFGFQKLLDIYSLMLSPEERIKEKLTTTDRFVQSFQNLGDFERYATNTQDSELLGKIKIVRTYHRNLPICISKISQKEANDITQADYVFTTAHKAKGLEFSTVRVTDDFTTDSTSQSQYREANMDEKNLLYVAVTRAKHALLLTPTLIQVLQKAGENFETMVSSSKLKKEDAVFKCHLTDAKFTPQALTLRKQDIKMGDGTLMKGGFVGPRTISEEYTSLAKLLGATVTEKS